VSKHAYFAASVCNAGPERLE